MPVQPVADPQSVQDADERGVALPVHFRQRDALKIALGPCVATERPLIVVFERALTLWAIHLLPEPHTTSPAVFCRRRLIHILSLTGRRLAPPTERSRLQLDTAVEACVKRLDWRQLVEVTRDDDLHAAKRSIVLPRRSTRPVQASELVGLEHADFVYN